MVERDLRGIGARLGMRYAFVGLAHGKCCNVTMFSMSRWDQYGSEAFPALGEALVHEAVRRCRCS